MVICRPLNKEFPLDERDDGNLFMGELDPVYVK